MNSASPLLLGFRNIACLSPHPDDVEYSMSETLLRYSGTNSLLALSSNGTPSDPSTYNVDRQEEVKQFWMLSLKRYLQKPSISYLMPPKESSNVHQGPPTMEEAIQELEKIDDEHRPEAWFIPPLQDTHQEHRFWHEALITALRHKSKTIIEYRTSSTTRDWIPNLFVPAANLDQKIQTLQTAFKSQADSEYFSNRSLKAFHQDFFHVKRGVESAESFRIQTMYA